MFSPMMLCWISSVPPAIDCAGVETRNLATTSSSSTTALPTSLSGWRRPEALASFVLTSERDRGFRTMYEDVVSFPSASYAWIEADVEPERSSERRLGAIDDILTHRHPESYNP